MEGTAVPGGSDLITSPATSPRLARSAPSASGGEFVMKNGRFENHLIIS